MIDFLATGAALLAAQNDDNNLGVLGLVFLLSGFVFYGVVFLRYRNVNKRHRHEVETSSTRVNLQQEDVLIRSMTGLRNAKMSGANNTAVSGAGGLPTSLGELKGSIGNLGSLMGQVSKTVQSQATKAQAAQQQSAHQTGDDQRPAAAPTSPPPAAPGAAPTPPPASPPPPAAPPASQPPPPAAPPGPPPDSGQSF